MPRSLGLRVEVARLKFHKQSDEDGAGGNESEPIHERNLGC